MTKTLELLIVIINYKTAKMVIDCLQTVLPQLKDNQSVVVVDNFSNDGSAEEIGQWINTNKIEQVKLILSPENTGFSGGNNIGIRSQAADNYLLLNSDTLLREGALQKILSTARDNPKAGLISPRLEWPDGRPQISCFRYHSPLSELIQSAASAPVTRLLRNWNVPIEISDQHTHPEWTSFACVLVKNEVIQEVGLMDEGFFLYYEDADYCRTARNAGWDIINNPSARVIHLRGGSSDVKTNISQKKRVPKYYYASRSRYFAKHYGRAGLALANLYWHAGRSISFIRECLGKKDIATREHEYIDIWINFTRPVGPHRNP